MSDLPSSLYQLNTTFSPIPGNKVKISIPPFGSSPFQEVIYRAGNVSRRLKLFSNLSEENIILKKENANLKKEMLALKGVFIQLHIQLEASINMSQLAVENMETIRKQNILLMTTVHEKEQLLKACQKDLPCSCNAQTSKNIINNSAHTELKSVIKLKMQYYCNLNSCKKNINNSTHEVDMCNDFLNDSIDTWEHDKINTGDMSKVKSFSNNLFHHRNYSNCDEPTAIKQTENVKCDFHKNLNAGENVNYNLDEKQFLSITSKEGEKCDKDCNEISSISNLPSPRNIILSGGHKSLSKETELSRKYTVIAGNYKKEDDGCRSSTIENVFCMKEIYASLLLRQNKTAKLLIASHKSLRSDIKSFLINFENFLLKIQQSIISSFDNQFSLPKILAQDKFCNTTALSSILNDINSTDKQSDVRIFNSEMNNIEAVEYKKSNATAITIRLSVATKACGKLSFKHYKNVNNQDYFNKIIPIEIFWHLNFLKYNEQRIVSDYKGEYCESEAFVFANHLWKFHFIKNKTADITQAPSYNIKLLHVSKHQNNINSNEIFNEKHFSSETLVCEFRIHSKSLGKLFARKLYVETDKLKNYDAELLFGRDKHEISEATIRGFLKFDHIVISVLMMTVKNDYDRIKTDVM